MILIISVININCRYYHYSILQVSRTDLATERSSAAFWTRRGPELASARIPLPKSAPKLAPPLPKSVPSWLVWLKRDCYPAVVFQSNVGESARGRERRQDRMPFTWPAGTAETSCATSSYSPRGRRRGRAERQAHWLFPSKDWSRPERICHGGRSRPRTWGRAWQTRARPRLVSPSECRSPAERPKSWKSQVCSRRETSPRPPKRWSWNGREEKSAVLE